MVYKRAKESIMNDVLNNPGAPVESSTSILKELNESEFEIFTVLKTAHANQISVTQLGAQLRSIMVSVNAEEGLPYQTPNDLTLDVLKEATLDLNLLMQHLIKAEFIDGACTLIFAANLIEKPVNTQWLAEVLPTLDDVSLMIPLIRSTTGDVSSVLFQLLEADVLSSERDSLILYFLARKYKITPPAQLITLLRHSTRRSYSAIAQLQIGLAAKLLDHKDLNQVAAQQISLADLYSPVETGLLALFESPVIELLPNQTTSTLVKGQTHIRKTSKVHRNDPCPCGSGKKFKKCCINKDVVDDEWETNPSKTMTRQQFEHLRPHEMAALDLAELSTEYLRIAIDKFTTFKRWDDASSTIDLLAERMNDSQFVTADDYRIDLLMTAIQAGNIEVAKKQKALIQESLDSTVNIKFEIAEPTADSLSELNNLALESLQTQNHLLMIELAPTLLKFFPAFGVFVARGILHENHPFDNETLVESIEEARDILQLPPNDYAQDLLDMLLERNVYAEVSPKIETQSSVSSKKYESELLDFQKKYKSAQHQIASLEQNLQTQEQALKAMLVSDVQESTSPDAQVSEADKDRELQLKRKIQELKSLIKAGNSERSQLRSQLSNMQNSTSEKNQEEPEIESDNLASLEFDISQEQLEAIHNKQQKMTMIPVFVEKARKNMQEVPEKIAQIAIQISANLATQLPQSWPNIKQLKSAKDVYSARLGIHYRMLFTIAAEQNELKVLTIIHRRELESALKKMH